MRKTEYDGSLVSCWRMSLCEFRSPKAVALCGVMCALGIVLNYVTTIDLGPYLRIGFSGLPNQAVDFILGPAAGAIFGAAMDIIKLSLRPSGMYFPGYTLSAALGAAIYGSFFYRRPVTWRSVICAHLLVKVFVNIGCNTLWHSMLFGKAFMVLLPPRVLANLISLPVDAVLTYFMLRFLSARVLEKFRSRS